MWIKIAFLTGLVVLSAFFSGTETAFVSLGKFKYKEYIRKKKKHYLLVQKLKDNPHKLISTVLIGNNLANIGAASLATLLGTELFIKAGLNISQAAAAGIITGALTLIILIFGEILPKTYAHNNYERVVAKSTPLIFFLSMVFSPAIYILDFISHIFIKTSARMEEKITEEEIRTMVNVGSDEGGIDKYEKHLINKIFQFDDKIAREIMTPRVKMYSIDAKSKMKDIIKEILNEGHSRVPIYEGSQDNIVGIFHIRDILDSLNKGKLNNSIKSISSKALFVPETKPIDDLFKEMQRKKIQMVIVVDEYGGVAGIITIEDLLEEIVGEIYDEEDEKEHSIIQLSKREYMIAGGTSLRDIKEKTKIKIDGMESDSINAYILEKFERIPKKNEEIKLKKGKLIIEEVTEKNIEKIRLRI
jgi:putative hemolysin